MVAYLSKVDIVNRALQLLRMHRIKDLDDQSLAAQEAQFAYPRLRDAELRTHLWKFATRRTPLYAVGPATYVWTPPTYAAGTSYALGAVVVDSDGNWWQSRKASNTAAPPTATTESANWGAYFGPDTVSPFVAAAASLAAPAAPALSQGAGGALGPRTLYVKITYTGAAGESLPSGESSLAVSASNYLSVTSPAAETGATGYNVYAGASPGSEVLQTATPTAIGVGWTEGGSGIAVNGAQPPQSRPASFYAGDLTYLPSSGIVYLSVLNNNTDTPPSPAWQAVNGTIAALQILYPIGAGPAQDITTDNVFRLPRGFLRQAVTNPKRTANTYLGAISGDARDDFVFQGGYFTSTEPGPVMLRYVADFVDVPLMEAAFCEMLAARLAKELGPRLIDLEVVQPLLVEAVRHYKEAHATAVGMNMIDLGPIDMPMSPYVACRF